MNYRLKDVADVGCTMVYEYDFGSTTELFVCINSVREGEKGSNEIVILSRNNPPEIICDNCKKNRAKWVDSMRYCEEAFWCEECLREEHDIDEDYMFEFLLPVCNSPRMGVCGYEGSRKYPEQFVPDKI